jgi:hypothetical protein
MNVEELSKKASEYRTKAPEPFAKLSKFCNQQKLYMLISIEKSLFPCFSMIKDPPNYLE